MQLPDISDVESAAERISGLAVLTPLLNFPVLDEATGARVFVKPESLQRTGSFKFRGAYNCISRIPESERANGVVACSSGNHAQGVAAAAKLLGIAATIVMPADAPPIKLARTRALGAEIVPYDRAKEDREAITRDLAERTGATLVHPFDNRFVIAGQGTVGLEMAEQALARGVTFDMAVTNAGGGGLTAGIALALEARMPACALYVTEPEGFDDQARSFETGTRQRNPKASGSICDALLSEMPGELTFAVNRSRVKGGYQVTDAEVLDAIGFAARELKLVVEPGGAAALAALLSGRFDARGKTVGIVISGGNVDPDILAEALRRDS